MTSVSAVILRNMPFNLLKEMRTKVSLQLVKVSVAHALISFFFLFQVLRVKNTSSTESHKVKGVLRVDTVTYRGNKGDAVKRKEFGFNLKPGTNDVVKMLVTFDEYYKRLVDQVLDLQIPIYILQIGQTC